MRADSADLSTRILGPVYGNRSLNCYLSLQPNYVALLKIIKDSPAPLQKKKKKRRSEKDKE